MAKSAQSIRVGLPTPEMALVLDRHLVRVERRRRALEAHNEVALFRMKRERLRRKVARVAI